MTEEIDAIKARLEELAAAIAEVKSRMPAHSVKPPMMHQLFELEDEYESLRRKLKAVSS
jgi:predicted transcriptional regulator